MRCNRPHARHPARRRPGVHELQVYVGVDPLTGRERRISRTVRGTRRDAERALAAVVTEVAAGRHAPGTATVSQMLERWVHVRSPSWVPRTLINYRSQIDNHIARRTARRSCASPPQASPARRSRRRSPPASPRLRDCQYLPTGQSLASGDITISGASVGKVILSPTTGDRTVTVPNASTESIQLNGVIAIESLTWGR